MHDFAFGRNDLHTQDQLARIAVAQHLRAAGIGGQIAAYGATAFRRQAQGEQAVGIARGLLHGLQNAAGLDHHGVVVGVDAAHLVQPPQRQDQRRAAVVGRGPAAQTGVAPLRDDRHLVGDAPLDELCHFLDRTRPGHGNGLAGIAAAPVNQIGLRVLAGQHILPPQHPHQFIQKLHCNTFPTP